MEFNNRLYKLRKQSGMSQEELANRLNVSRQTISKWEVGDSTPDLEKLVAISDLFHISLDELVSGKGLSKNDEEEKNDDKKNESNDSANEDEKNKTDVFSMLDERVLTEENKKKAKKGFKIAAIVAGAIVLIDVASMIIYFLVNGVPK